MDNVTALVLERQPRSSRGRVGTDIDGYQKMLAAGREFRDRVWAGEGCAWLTGITHTGLVRGTLALPEVTFDGVQLANRVDALELSPAMNWWRIAAIHTEVGGLISINYSSPDCVAGSHMPAAPESNTLRCYPVLWTPAGASAPIVDYFNKYVVDSVLETDRTGGAAAIVTAYSYLTPPAWRYTDDDGVVADQDKTWSQWRGYGLVGVTKGYPGEQSYAETRFFRGMNGDHLPSGTRTVSVPDSLGGSWPDDDAFAGMAREQIVYNGPGGPQVSGTVTDPWESAPTATRGSVTARRTATQATHSRTALDGGRGFRSSTTESQFDANGHPTQVEDRGDDSILDDSRCTRYTYVSNTTAWLIDLTARTESYALPCSQAPTRPEDVIADVRTSYDALAFGATPVRGLPTQTETIKSWAAGGNTYSVTARSGYDSLGRTTDSGVSRISDQSDGVATDVQCFQHDYLQRLTEAWTPASGDCTAAPTAAGLGGPAPYWESWSFDLAGDRQSQTNHATAAGDVRTDYTRPAAGASQPHGVTSSSQQDNNGTTVRSYGYDAGGNTTSRPGPAGQQTLAWDAEGHLSSVTDTSGKNDYVYDASDRRLIEHEPTGATLHLPNTELRLTKASQQVTATRYYVAAGGIVCQRTAGGVSWLIGDDHGSGYLSIDAATQVETRRRLDPYGNPRGSNTAWPNPRGFVGGTNDPTGLVHLGAREYDPLTGGFTSVDPQIDLSAPTTLNPYGYGGNNPVTYSDPEGLSWFSGLVKTLQACNNGATWAGIGMMVLGGIADAGGGLLIATGVGAPLGVALEIAGTDAIVAGATLATAGIVAGCAQTIMNSTSDGGGGGGGSSASDPDPNEANANRLVDEHNQSSSKSDQPLSQVNAYNALERDVPPGTKPVVKGPTEPGADIEFQDSSGNVVLRREVKTASNGNRFGEELSRGSKQVGLDGEVDIQVPRGTSSADVKAWLNKFRSQPGRTVSDYQNVKVQVYDQDGVDLGSYNAAQDPPDPPGPHTHWHQFLE